jgi:hypothetical protein
MVTEAEYQSIVEYVSRKIAEDQCMEPWLPAELQQLCPYNDWKLSRGKMKKVKKPVEGKWSEEWQKWWNLWPSSKSVPNTQFKSGAVMKKDEQKMYQKWLEVVELNRSIGGDTAEATIQSLYKAADCYLQWGYYDSIRKGKNELEVRSGMEPWLNQKQYLIYATMEYPPTVKKPESHQMVGI